MEIRCAGAPLTIEEIDLEGPRSGEVLIEVKATGICHTDCPVEIANPKVNELLMEINDLATRDFVR